ncbi:MAG: TetR/AcrR family transcriptional regulator [Xanthomonadaceae bacterium]|nr:TetR/AcrR family transcriptional regulator [Xanthomonadaceae bacterium]
MARKPAHEQFDTLKAIQDCAFDLFGRYGYDGVSIGAISAAAKLSKGALYWHYASKEALFLACLKRLHSLFDSHIFEPMRRPDADPVASVLALFQGMARLLQDPLLRNGIAGYWLIPDSPETAAPAAEQRAFEARSAQAIRDALARGIDAGRFDFGDDLDDMSRAIISIVEAVILPLRHQTPEDVHRTLGVLARTLFRAYDKSGSLPLF